MKKREKFLLAFIISWCVVMCVQFVNMIKTTRYYSLHSKELREWIYYGDEDFEGYYQYDNITEEAKEYFRNEVKEQEQREKELEIEEKQYCEENPDSCAYIKTEEHKIEEAALNHYLGRVMQESQYAYQENDRFILVYDGVAAIIALTFVIYFASTIEFNNFKQYIKENVKVIVVLGMLLLCNFICFNLYLVICGLNNDFYFGSGLYTSMFGTDLIRYLTMYLIMLCSNIIVNVVKRSKSKDKKKE